jgi:hypothetical protein
VVKSSIASMKEWIAEKLVDPTGMIELQENIRFINHQTEGK